MNKDIIIESINSLKIIDKPNSNLEQYFTPVEIAFDFIEKLNLKDKIILDLGCGSGNLGFIALLLGAKKVIFLDVDKRAIEVSENNYYILKKKFPNIGDAIFLNKDVSLLKKSELDDISISILNPPFGTTDENKKIDVIFLKKAMKMSNKILTMHKTASKMFIENVIKDNNFKIIFKKDILFPLPKMYSHHQEEQGEVKVTIFILEKY